jgi:hypothetical protein
VFYLFVATMIAVTIARGQGDAGGRIFFAVWLLASLAWIAYMLWAQPVSVAGWRGDFSGQYATIRHRKGKIRMMTFFADFHDLLSTLQRLNPAIEIKRL